MALIPSGMGWSAEESYMKEYAGVIGTLNGISGAANVPIGTRETANETGIWLWSITANNVTTDYYLAVDRSPAGLFTVAGGMGAGAYCIASRSTSTVYWVSKFVNGVFVGTQQQGNTSAGPASGWRWDSFTILVPSGASYSRNTSIPDYETASIGFAALTYETGDITKTVDGYCTAAWVKYKVTDSTVVSTPVLISTIPAYTLFGPSEVETFSALYQGMRFYISYSTELESGSPQGILTLDYSGSDYSVMTPMLLFDYVAQAVSLTIVNTIDPYSSFPHTGEDGGIPNPEPQDDDIEVDPLPSMSFSGAGFCRIYNPDLSDLQDLADYMWTDQNFLTTVINHLKQLIENPIDAVVSLSLVPVVPDRESAKSAVKVMFIDTGVSMRRVTNQFKSVDCGTVFVEEKYGSVLDYNPYTKVQLYLPFVGTVPLNTDEVMNKTLSVVYHVDVVTGVCCAEVSADSKLLYQFSGHCSVSQPLNSADFGSYLNAAMAAAKIAVGAATGGAGAAAAAGSALDQISPPSTTSPTSVSRDPLLPSGTSLVPAGYYGSGSGVRAPQSEKGNPSSGSESPNIWEILKHPGTINSAAAVLGGKLDVQHSGGFSGNSGFLAKRRPYLIINRPQLANPEQYGQFNGYPSMIYASLGTCIGYTQVQSVFLSGFDALPSELSEISSVLKAGVVF